MSARQVIPDPNPPEVAWDPRIVSVDKDMVECRFYRRLHIWEFLADEVIEERGGRIVIYERRSRCGNGCKTEKFETTDARSFEMLSRRYVWDDEYKKLGDGYDPRAIRREIAIRENPKLFAYLVPERNRAIKAAKGATSSVRRPPPNPLTPSQVVKSDPLFVAPAPG